MYLCMYMYVNGMYVNGEYVRKRCVCVGLFARITIE